MRKHFGHYSRLMVLLASAGALVAQTEHNQRKQAGRWGNAFTGAWKINIAKSKPAFPVDLKGKTITFAPDGTFIINYVENGKAVRSSHRWSGGAEVPIEGTASWTKNAIVIGAMRDAHTYEETLKVNGKIGERARLVVSPDGKMMTMTASGTDDQGRAIYDLEVYDKQ